MQLKNPHKNNKYGEEPQSLVVKFAFCKRDGEDFSTIHNFVNCRDFLSDVVWWKANQQYDRDVYGFKVSKDDIEGLQPYMALTSDLMPALQSNLKALAGIIATHQIDAKTVVLELAPYWLANPVNVSLLTLSLKLLALGADRPFSDLVGMVEDHKEGGYLKKIGTARFLALVADPASLPTEPLTMKDHENVLAWPSYQIHDYLGIVSMFAPHSPKSNLKEIFQQKQKQTEVNEGRTTKAKTTRIRRNSAAAAIRVSA